MAARIDARVRQLIIAFPEGPWSAAEVVGPAAVHGVAGSGRAVACGLPGGGGQPFCWSDLEERHHRSSSGWHGQGRAAVGASRCPSDLAAVPVRGRTGSDRRHGQPWCRPDRDRHGSGQVRLDGQRELRRNLHTTGQYRPFHAQVLAAQRRRRPKQPKLAGNAELRGFVVDRLAERWSPQQISPALVLRIPTSRACGWPPKASIWRCTGQRTTLSAGHRR